MDDMPSAIDLAGAQIVGFAEPPPVDVNGEGGMYKTPR